MGYRLGICILCGKYAQKYAIKGIVKYYIVLKPNIPLWNVDIKAVLGTGIQWDSPKIQ